MQQRMYENCLNNVDELKQRLIDAWNGMQQNVIGGQRVEKETESIRMCTVTTF